MNINLLYNYTEDLRKIYDIFSLSFFINIIGTIFSMASFRIVLHVVSVKSIISEILFHSNNSGPIYLNSIIFLCLISKTDKALLIFSISISFVRLIFSRDFMILSSLEI